MPNQNEDNGTGILTTWGKRFFSIVGLIVLALLIAFALSDRAGAEALEWDKSSITLDGRCLPDGLAEFTVTNTGAPMAGPSAWREYEADVLKQDGTFQLDAGAARVWTFASNGVAVRFEADQRPGHPGASAPRLTLTCSIPTALTLTAFSATSGGNRGGCAHANKIRGLACTVTKFVPGYVSGTCDGGFTFSRVRTSRTFRDQQPVTVQGCIGGDGWQLIGVAGWPLRISR